MKNRSRLLRQKQYAKWTRMVIVLFAVLDLILAGYLIERAVTTQAYAIQSTVVQPERFTELYFTNHQHLPATIFPAYPYSFGFVIHNLEGQDETYAYEVSSQTGNTKALITKGSIRLKDNESKTLTGDFSFSPGFTKGEVVVNLINKNQHIAFWVGENK